jgi:hypothetical protein
MNVLKIIMNTNQLGHVWIALQDVVNVQTTLKQLVQLVH